MNTLKPTGWIISNDAAIIAVGATLADAIADYNRDVGGILVTLEDGTRDYAPMTEDNLGGHIARQATAALLAQVEDVGGAISWEVVNGVACTCDEAAPPVRQIATSLSEAGRRALAEFLAENLNDKALRTLVSAWEPDITFDINDGLAGHLEIGGYYSDTGNPTTRVFDGDEVVLEDVEVEE